MYNELSFFIIEAKEAWKIMNIKSILKIKSLLEVLATNETVGKSLLENMNNLLKGEELYSDEEHGFLLTAYSESKGTYRVPHNHGNGWVVYAVVEGVIEMGNYVNLVKTNGLSELILKSSNKMVAGDCTIYYPGEIHDTRCVSENVIILRLTSCDLKEEERQGRMLRFK